MNGENLVGLDDPLAVLEVIDTLEVGPVKLNNNRLTAEYKVIRGSSTEHTTLIYKYDEDVFIPDDPSAVNLASMIAAQAALNYGLFCKNIVFHGSYDSPDRRFIRDMAENTAREIYVNRFLQDNPFIIGEAASLPAVRIKKYCRSKIVFENTGKDAFKVPWKLWNTDSRRHAVLSSGGKDSLLTFGLLNEIGAEAHPVFINESGRHWFTALNAYRYFKKNIPGTARVWTNADRVFNWMLRRLPFIKPDYQKVRADIYPVRLWTVAVFLFGAVPLVRKRRIGRLLIGDEFDTSLRSTHQGITNYEGLYDQSIFFDNMMSRYFMAKGWSLVQFSILRNLSELLIQKILVERYPHLQEHQVSCHASHKDEDRIKPCGKCEKCRRIISMLKALDADYRTCGYSDNQVEKCLKDFASKGIHQEERGFRHLLYILNNKKIIELPAENRKKLKPYPEIMQIRFDREKAPLTGMPAELRHALFRIYSEHAEGAVQRRNRRWLKYAPLNDPNINTPYVFESGGSTQKGEQLNSVSADNRKTYMLGELTWPEAEQRLQEVDIALLPVGAIEQHGPHLPLDTDAYDAEYLAQQVALACSNPKPLVLPLIPYGVSYHHDEFPGTISINNKTLSNLVYEIGMNAARNGIKKLLIINGHGGNSPALDFAAQLINRDARIFVGVDSGETSDVDIYEMIETPNDVHAGEFETSTSLAIRPGHVKMEQAKQHIPKFSSRYLNFTSKRGISWHAYTKKISSTGVMGDPTRASAEKGRKMWQIMIAHLVAFVEDLKRMTLDEIHQRRY